MFFNWLYVFGLPYSTADINNMGIKEDSVNIKFNWRKYSTKTKTLISIIILFTLSLIRFSYSTEYIGYFAGECSKGLCRQEYTISNNQIVINETSEDTASDVHKVINGDFSQLKFKAPLLLLTNITGKFGCPDCNDGGGYLLGFKILGFEFTFTAASEASPWYFKEMTELISDRIKRIEEIQSEKSKN